MESLPNNVKVKQFELYKSKAFQISIVLLVLVNVFLIAMLTLTYFSSRNSQEQEDDEKTEEEGLRKPSNNWQKLNSVVQESSDKESSDFIPQGSPGTGDSKGTSNNYVIYDKTELLFKMWYTGTDGDGVRRIFYATSLNGHSWYKFDNSIPSASNINSNNGRLPLGLEGTGDSKAVYNPVVLKESNKYFMWYTGEGDKFVSIYLAESLDGINWTKRNNAVHALSNSVSTDGRIPQGTNDKGDSAAVLTGDIVKTGSSYIFYYSGTNPTNLTSVFAASSNNKLDWNKIDNSVAIANNLTSFNGKISYGQKGNIDSTIISFPSVLKLSDSYISYFTMGDDFKNLAIGYGESSDGLSWRKILNTFEEYSVFSLQKGNINEVDSKSVTSARLLYNPIEKVYFMWYTASDDKNITTLNLAKEI